MAGPGIKDTWPAGLGGGVWGGGCAGEGWRWHIQQIGARFL